MRLESLPYADILQRIRARAQNLQFVARTNTSWTTMGFEAWLSVQPADVSGAVIVMPSKIGAEAVVPPATLKFIENFPNVDVWVAEGFRAEEYQLRNRLRAKTFPQTLVWLAKSLRCPGPRLRVVSPRHRDLALVADLIGEGLPLQALQFDLLDEGFGCMEAAGWYGWSFFLEVNARKGFLRWFPTVDHFLVDHAPPSSRRSSGVWYCRNEALVQRYRESIARHSVVNPLALPAGRVALVLTSYLAEGGFTTLEQEIAANARIVRELQHKGYGVILKQHPREEHDKYATLETEARQRGYFARLDASIGAESVLPFLRREDIVVGMLTNVLFSAQTLFRLPVYLVPGRDVGIPRREIAERSYARVMLDGLPPVWNVPAL